VNGLRVGGGTSGDGLAKSAAFEVTHGELILIDVKLENIIMERNIDVRKSEENENSKMKGLIMMGEKA
jgi:hypothetical protein